MRVSPVIGSSIILGIYLWGRAAVPNSLFDDVLTTCRPLLRGHTLRTTPNGSFNDQERDELIRVFTLAQSTIDGLGPQTEVGALKRRVKLEWERELSAFLNNHPTSALSADLLLQLGKTAQLRSSYTKAEDCFVKAWNLTRDSEDRNSREIRNEAAAALAEVLAITGKFDLLSELERSMRALGMPLTGRGWWWVLEKQAHAAKHPEDAFKCGVHGLQVLGNLTFSGQFNAGYLENIESTTNGFTVAELIQIGRNAGLPVTAAAVESFENLPFPSVVHLKFEHFVIATEKRNGFILVIDPLVNGLRSLTPEELAEEATGCVIINNRDIGSPGVAAISMEIAGQFRGRCGCNGPDHHTDPTPCEDCECPAGTSGGKNGIGVGGPPPKGGGSTAAVESNSECCGGMGYIAVSQPYLNAWIIDKPLTYKPGLGPEVQVRLATTARRSYGGISGAYFQGASAGTYTSCSLLSWVDLDASEAFAEVMMPGGNWAKFTFSGTNTLSDVNYRKNMVLEKVIQTNYVTSCILHFKDGKKIEYGIRRDVYGFYNFYMTAEKDAPGNATTFAYHFDGYDYLLTNVVAADGVNFAVAYDPSTYLVTNIAASFGSSVSLKHGETDMGDGTYDPDTTALTRITDPVGIVSRIGYSEMYYATKLVTPYGTTTLDYMTTNVFDQVLRITHPNSAVELYGLIGAYYGSWDAFSSSVIPSGTPIGTLDTGERHKRNTFHWNIRQFDGLENTPYENFTTNEFKKARIRHWLGVTGTVVPKFDTLSWEQDPSPDGSTEGAVTWYDYANKPQGYNHEIGSQIMPSVVARVMPDGSTWYKYWERNSWGKPTQEIEKWVENGSATYRTNTYSYSADGTDLVEHRFKANGTDKRIAGYGYSNHQPTSFTNAVSEVETWTYNGSKQLVTYQNAAGMVISNTYGTNYCVSKAITYENGIGPVSTNEYTWSNGNIRTHTDGRGLSITNTWDGLNRLTKMDFPDGSYIQHAYTNGSGTKLLDRTYTRDRMTNVTRWTYNSMRQVESIIDPIGTETRHQYCDCGALEAITRAYGTSLAETTEYFYNNVGWLDEIDFPNGSWRTNAFDLLGRITIIGTPLGTTTNMYDNLNRFLNSSNAFGQIFAAVYDAEDNVTSRADANGIAVTMTYEALDRLRTRTFPDGGVEAFGYTVNVSGPTSYTNQLSKVTTYVYDKLGRKTKEVVVGLSTNTFTFSPGSDLLTLTDGKSQVTTWGYDIYGRVASKKFANNSTNLVYSYDASSRLTNRWSQAKGNTKYTYDANGNLTKIDYASSPDVTFKHDALNRSTNEVVAGAFTNNFSYHLGGSVATEDGPWPSDTITYYTNSAGLRSGMSVQQPTGSFTNGYSYDSAGRLSSITSHSGSYVYDYYPTNGGFTTATRLIRKLTLPQSAYITNSFDNNGRQTRTRLMTSTDGQLNDHEYVYNVSNQRTRQTYTDDSYVTYTYDDAGQLRTAYTTNSSGVEIATQRYMYGYDAAWNMVSRTNNVTVESYFVNNLNQVDGPADSFYDDNGNHIGDQSDLFIEYDDENRLSRIELKDTERVDYYYDARGRIRRERGSILDGGEWLQYQEIWYIYDGMQVVQDRDSNNTPLRGYTRGIDLSGGLDGAGGIGGLLALSLTYQSGIFTNHLHYHSDANGNVTYLMKANQTVSAQYRYDPFGRTLTSSGANAWDNLYRFSSKRTHNTFPFYYFGYRFYDPNAQRWLNRDPFGEIGFEAVRRTGSKGYNDHNLYRFVVNDAVNNLDALGLKLYKCTRDTEWGFDGGGQHVYIYDDAANDGKGSSCGRGGGSCKGEGVDNDTDKGPGTPGHHCVEVPGSEGKEDDIMACCKKKRKQPFCPGVTDCHNWLERCFKKNGVEDPDTGGRFRKNRIL